MSAVSLFLVENSSTAVSSIFPLCATVLGILIYDSKNHFKFLIHSNALLLKLSPG